MRLPILFIVLTMVLDGLGVGLLLPVMPQLLSSLQGAGTPNALAQAAAWGGVLSMVYALSQFACGPALGALSDRWGRRPVLLVSLAVMALDYLVMAWATSLWVLLVGRIVSGMAAATHATALAYMADISGPNDRSRAFGLVSAGLGVGFILGPVLGGWLATLDLRAPFHAAAAVAGANALLGWLVLKESLPGHLRRPLDIRQANPLSVLSGVRALPTIKPLLLAVFIFQTGYLVYPAVWAYYTEAALGWTTQQTGWALGLFGVSVALVQAGLLRVTQPLMGERGSALAGMLASLFCVLAFASMPDDRMVWLLVPLAALGGLVMPVLQAQASQSVTPDQQGTVLGLIGSMTALAMVVSPLLMTQTFQWATHSGAAVYWPGAPFALAAVFVGLAAVVFLCCQASAPVTLKQSAR